MGMSASQTRVLMLTARQNDLEYQAQQILQAKLAASRQAEEASAAYEEKMSNTHFIMKTNENGEEVQKNVNAYTVYESGFYITDRDGNIILPPGLSSGSLEGEAWQYGATSNSNLKGRCKTDDMLGKNYDKGGADSHFKEMIDKGEYILCRKTTVRDGALDEDGNPIKNNIFDRETTMDGTAEFAEVYYTADDAEAEAKYNTMTKKLESLEKKLDMQMEQIETERSAVKTEKESVESVVKDNVESTFKTFG